MKRTKNPAKEAEYRKRAADLVAQMTLHEKVSQMLSWAPAIERLGIPAYNWWSEGIHGVGRAGTATVFPQAIGMAAAFDEDMMEQVGNAVGVEARGKYNMCRAHGDRDIFKGLTVWAPNINIFRDPRWGRGHETYGEDPFLTSRLGVRFVEGMQGDDPDYLQAAACAKHFAVHSAPKATATTLTPSSPSRTCGRPTCPPSAHWSRKPVSRPSWVRTTARMASPAAAARPC